MEKKDRSITVIKRLKKVYPHASIALKFGNNWELLVATELSAQCTDKKVNEVTETLFKKYRTVADYAHADSSEFEQDIRPTGFFRNKTKNIIGAAQMVLTEFGGDVPRTMNEIIRLPGVARKTANIVLGNAYGVVDGIAVDTHVQRLSRRLGLSEGKTPEIIERDLMDLWPRAEWFGATYLLIEHGRAVCTAKKPQCGVCVLNDICPSAFKV
jgi:endonuclease III